ncbi:unnamed protein product, partial [Mesorhabditis spiculigera]
MKIDMPISMKEAMIVKENGEEAEIEQHEDRCLFQDGLVGIYTGLTMVAGGHFVLLDENDKYMAFALAVSWIMWLGQAIFMCWYFNTVDRTLKLGRVFAHYAVIVGFFTMLFVMLSTVELSTQDQMITMTMDKYRLLYVTRFLGWMMFVTAIAFLGIYNHLGVKALNDEQSGFEPIAVLVEPTSQKCQAE